MLVLSCDRLQIVSWGFVDVPNVVADENGVIQICGSTKWKRFSLELPEIFVSILCHESLHIVLRAFGADASEELDNVGSLSTISRSLRDIAKCRKYSHGLIGLKI